MRKGHKQAQRDCALALKLSVAEEVEKGTLHRLHNHPNLLEQVIAGRAEQVRVK